MPGTADLCVVCGEWQVFTLDGVRRPTEREAAAFAKAPHFRMVRTVWERMQREIGNQAGGIGFDW